MIQGRIDAELDAGRMPRTLILDSERADAAAAQVRARRPLPVPRRVEAHVVREHPRDEPDLCLRDLLDVEPERNELRIPTDWRQNGRVDQQRSDGPRITGD